MSARIVRGPRVDFEKTTKGLGEFFFESGDKHGDKICHIQAETGKTETFRSVKERSTRVAIHLLEMGIKPGDVVACCLKNKFDSVIAVVASLYVNAIIASLDVGQSSRECAYCLKLVHPKLIFADEDAEAMIEKSLVEAGLDVDIVVVGKSSNRKTLCKMLKHCTTEKEFRPVAVEDCHDTAFLNFSSGTTGNAKAISISHFALVNEAIYDRFTPFDEQSPDITMHFGSLFWILPIVLLTRSMAFGNPRVLSSKYNVPAENTLKYIETYKVTFLAIQPIYTYALSNLKDFDTFNVSSLKVLLISGAATNGSQILKMAELFPDTNINIAYGSTEAVGAITYFGFIPSRDVPVSKVASVGKCVNNADIKVVDTKTRKILGPYEQGEICFRKPYAMNGYYKLDSSDVYDDGFIRTGDIGYYDEDEYFYIVGRIKEMFKYKSWQVLPFAVENILEEHPDVKEAVVFGIPHEIDEFHPAAFVVLKEGAKVSVEDIQKFASDKVSEVQKLRGGIKIVDTIARTSTGKKVRRGNAEIFLKLQ
ncbi:hypothetical protein NQ315_006812 [Exocentrus adspersus]|uniref:Uncharacterized protein n=1 Tax=Exocentrus adspersus TaxID=1586481 RepID=A0AAV8WDC3_9CUCU|nr:hypothetical protein NQ315_006812 [Exocentrus adspersus]